MDPLLHDLQRDPEQVLLRAADRRWTRGEVAAVAGAAARGLADRGVSPGDRVAVVARAGARAVVAMLAARATGAVVCPVDPRRAGDLVADLGARAVIDPQESGAPGTLAWADLARRPAELDPVPGGDVAWAVATSGTGGRCRRVALTERGVAHVARAVSEVVPYRPADRVLWTLPGHHTYGLSQLWLALRTGASLVLPDGPVLPGDLASWLAKATVWPTVPPALRLAVESSAPPHHLRLVTLSGQFTGSRDRDRFQAALPETEIVLFFGLTESTTRVLWLPAEHLRAYPEASGRPIPGVSVRLDEDGELCVSGPNVALGYLDDPVATAERFVGGELRTGDLFRRVGPYWGFVGRRDGVFKSFGEKVVPEEVERVLLDHPDIRAALVLPRWDEATGQDRPAAWVVAGSEVRPSVAELSRHARSSLPAESVPATWTLVDHLPTTDTGKPLRRPPE